MLLAIDPGQRTGWALFEDQLKDCGVCSPASGWAQLVAESGPGCDVIIEEPTIYPHSKARPADVMTLQLKVGELKGRFEAVGCIVELVQPRTWKRQVPKTVHNARVLKRLTDEERRIVRNAGHDTLDAIGLGLWKLGRL